MKGIEKPEIVDIIVEVFANGHFCPYQFGLNENCIRDCKMCWREALEADYQEDANHE
jgi:hypothetical protein